MLYQFPPPQWFESGSASHVPLLVALWTVIVGVPSSVLLLSGWKPKKRIVWWLAEVFFVVSCLFVVCFIGYLMSRDRFSSLPLSLHPVGIVYWVTIFFGLPAMIAGAAELLRANERALGFRDPTIWIVAIPLSMLMFFKLGSLHETSVPRQAVARTNCRNNLKVIGKGLLEHADVYGHFPASQVSFLGADGQPIGPACSWRVALLPYVDQAPLYNNYHRESAWDSRHNREFALQRLPVYRCPAVPLPNHHDDVGRFYSAYAVLVGSNTAFSNDNGLEIQSITDGLSTTVLVVEACGRQIIWTEPRDISLGDSSIAVNLPGKQPGQSAATWSAYHFRGAHTLLADGSVRFVSEDADPEVLRAITTVNGGERIEDSDSGYHNGMRLIGR